MTQLSAEERLEAHEDPVEMGALRDWIGVLGLTLLVTWILAYYLLPSTIFGRFSAGSLFVGLASHFTFSKIAIVVGIWVSMALVLLARLSLSDNTRSVLSITAGMLYTVPYFGAFVSTVTIGLVAYATRGLVTAIVVTVVMIVIHQVVFDNIVAPRVIGGSVNLHPLLTLSALLAGGTLFGIGGTLLAVPIAAALQVILVQIYPQLKLDVRSMKKMSKESRTSSEAEAVDLIAADQQNPDDENQVATMSRSQPT